jgi:hypothetical protein
MIASTNGSVITIQFTNFSTQPTNDVVRVFQCSDVYCSQQQQLAELSGMYLSTQVMTSATGYMRVVFTSDGSINHAGFAASWSSVSWTCFDPLLMIMTLAYGGFVTFVLTPGMFVLSGRRITHAAAAGKSVGCLHLQMARSPTVQALQSIPTTPTASG